MSATKILDHMGYAIDGKGPQIGLAPLGKSTTVGRAKIKQLLDKQGIAIDRQLYNFLEHSWQVAPQMHGIRIASDEQGNPLVFAEKPKAKEPERIKMTTTADIARAHGKQTMRRIRGA